MLYQNEHNAELDDGVVIAPPKLEDKAKANAKREKDRPKAGDDQKELQDIDPSIFAENFKRSNKIIHQLEGFGFDNKYIKDCLQNADNNLCTTTYYLLEKDQEKIA